MTDFCGCGYSLPAAVGKYGCPNCGGDNFTNGKNMKKPHGLKGKPGNRAGTGTRGANLNIRISPADRALIAHNAAQRGLSQSAYVVALVKADDPTSARSA